ncbi:MAG: inorganic phosphate transporter [Gammaproteobacteria bacterium]|nr:inorganic phosphate transporter [Gammaproteobacteria bacterium]
MFLPSGNNLTLRILLTLVFLVGIYLYVNFLLQDGAFYGLIVLAALFGGYMAIVTGANDTANSLGPPVGAKAITLPMALVIAVLFEMAGALIAGGDVTQTIKGEIIDPGMICDQQDFVWLMLSALLAAAIWVHLATALGVPVSSTHAIIGGILGAGISIGGFGITNWPKLAAIASSWIVSPLMAGLIAAFLLYLIKRTLTHKADMVGAAKRVVPLLVAAMGWAFSVYLILKGLKQVLHVDFWTAILTSFIIATGIYLIVQPAIVQTADRLPQSKMGINSLFNIPLVFAAALLSFAHGANDLANTIGPLAAIHEVLLGTGVTDIARVPFWIVLVGAIGISIGVAFYGPKMIRIVGYEITELDQMRAYCIAMAVSLTIILASELSIPVSTTHTVVGAVLGVGFLREYLKNHYAETREKITRHLEGQKLSLINRFIDQFHHANILQKRAMMRELETHSKAVDLTKKERKQLHNLYHKEIVKKSTFLKILFMWLLTIPTAGLIASLIYLLAQTIQST